MHKNKKALEMTISFFVIIILGILVLIGLAYVLTNGFQSFRTTTDPILRTSEATAFKTACQLACDQTNKLSYCCTNATILNQEIYCNDSRLELNCPLDCSSFNCTPH